MRGKEDILSLDLMKNVDYLAVQDEKDINFVLQSIEGGAEVL
jgi:hypothetical protein